MVFFHFGCDFGKAFSTQEFHVLMIEKTYLLETSADLWFSNIFRGYRKRPVASNALKAAISVHY